MRYSEILKLKECTSSSSVASVVSSINAKDAEDVIGVGMDPNGDWGIYDQFKPKKKNKNLKNNPLVVKRK